MLKRFATSVMLALALVTGAVQTAAAYQVDITCYGTWTYWELTVYSDGSWEFYGECAGSIGVDIYM